MCVAIVRFQPGSALPVVVGFNRDEVPARDAGAPAVFEWRGRRVLAAREPVHGGTWLGLNETGLVVGLLNRIPAAGCCEDHEADAPVRSRGLLVLDCLSHPGVEGVRGELRSLADRYEPFNLFAVDGRSALAVHSEGGRLEVVPLAPGLHVFAHGDVDDRRHTKIARVHQAAPTDDAPEPTDWIDWVRVCLSTHADDPTSEASPCRHGTGYRTLCSTVLAVAGRHPLRARFLHAAGPPCTTPYRDLTPLIAELAGS